MNKCAILHIPQSQYAYALNEHTLTIRIRTAKKDITSCYLYYGDRACQRTPVDFTQLKMEAASSDELFDYYEITFITPYTRVCYYFKLETNGDWTYYYGEQFRKELPDYILNNQIIEGRSEYFQYPFILRSEILSIPDWFQNAVIYNIFPDSFATAKEHILCESKSLLLKDGNMSKSRLGGNIRGIIENLDYIRELGFTCIYLNPIFTAGEYHKYDLLDYYHIDPCLGTDDDFCELVEKLHSKDMKIIIDGVFNHCSWYFFAFDDVVRKGENSKYKDWFYELEFPVLRPSHDGEAPSYSCFAYEKKMPKLNTAHNEVIEYFKDVCTYWIQKFDIDGWRLDVANEIDKNFWRSFRLAAKEAKPEIALIGEVWENSEVWLRGDIFDSTMNYDFRKHCKDFFAFQNIDAKVFTERIHQMYYRYPASLSHGQLNLLDSHDVPRFLSLCEGNLFKWRLAAVFLFLSPGVPCLFYGDEKGISGISEKEYRSQMIWEIQDKHKNLTAFIKNLISIRKNYVDNSLKSYKFFSDTGKSQDYLLALKVETARGTLLLYMNVSETPCTVSFDAKLQPLMTEGIYEGRFAPYAYGIFLESTVR